MSTRTSDSFTLVCGAHHDPHFGWGMCETCTESAYRQIAAQDKSGVKIRDMEAWFLLDPEAPEPSEESVEFDPAVLASKIVSVRVSKRLVPETRSQRAAWAKKYYRPITVGDYVAYPYYRSVQDQGLSGVTLSWKIMACYYGDKKESVGTIRATAWGIQKWVIEYASAEAALTEAAPTEFSPAEFSPAESAPYETPDDIERIMASLAERKVAIDGRLQELQQQRKRLSEVESLISTMAQPSPWLIKTLLAAID